MTAVKYLAVASLSAITAFVSFWVILEVMTPHREAHIMPPLPAYWNVLYFGAIPVLVSGATAGVLIGRKFPKAMPWMIGIMGTLLMLLVIAAFIAANS